MPRRYAWFRRVLKHHDDDDAAIFPPDWQVTRLLISSFADYTRGDLANVLGKGTPNVNVLLEGLQATLDFEAVISKRFEMPVGPVPFILCPTDDNQFDQVTSVGLAGQGLATRWTISSIFDTHFGVYVEAQDRCVHTWPPFASGLTSYQGYCGHVGAVQRCSVSLVIGRSNPGVLRRPNAYRLTVVHRAVLLLWPDPRAMRKIYHWSSNEEIIARLCQVVEGLLWSVVFQLSLAWLTNSRRRSPSRYEEVSWGSDLDKPS